MDLQVMLKHHHWANQIYFDKILSIDSSLYSVPIPGIDTTIQQLLYHLCEVFWGWYHQMTDENYENPPSTDLSVSEYITQIKILEEKIDTLVSTGDLDRDITLQFSEDDTPVVSNPRNMIFNFITHSAYHRGQLAFLLRYHGFSGLPETDYNPYVYGLGQE